jgi:hypothetical protein
MSNSRRGEHKEELRWMRRCDWMAASLGVVENCVESADNRGSAFKVACVPASAAQISSTDKLNDTGCAQCKGSVSPDKRLRS